MRKFLWFAAEFLVGLLPGFFLVFNFMFTDVTSAGERVFSFLLTAVTYLVLGTAFGLTGYAAVAAGLWLSLPALILVFMYSFRETGSIAVNLIYGAIAIGSAIAGSRLGYKFSKNRK